MPRDKDKDNDYRRGRRERPGGRQDGGGSRDGNRAGRGGEKRLTRQGFGGKREDGGERDRDRREQRPFRRRDDRPPRREFEPRGERRERDDFRADRGQRERFRKDGPRKRFDRGQDDRGDAKPWRRHDERPREQRADERPRKRFDREQDAGRDAKPWRKRDERPRDERVGERPRFERARDRQAHEDRPKFARPRFERPHRERDEERSGLSKRTAFGGRGAYRERKTDTERRPQRQEVKPKKIGERIAKVLARAGLASRRDAEEWIVQGRVAVNGRIINSPALDVTASDMIAVDGEPLPARERTRLFLYHKPRGLMTTHSDPEGRPTVFDNLPEGLPRLVSVGRLDFNTEGLLLLTNDGGLARVLELPETGWLRRYRVRAHGEIAQAQLDALRNGIEVDGVKYGPIEAALEREQGANVWLVFAIREGKNREVRNVLAHLGLEVNRLIRISYGPFQLGDLPESEVTEIKTRVLREQLGEKVIAQAGADFAIAAPTADDEPREAPGKRPFKPSGKSGLITDRKGHRVLVKRSGSDEARSRNEAEAHGYGPPRRPKRGYHGKRDFRPRES